jgi:hypothetical protein
MEFEFPIEPGRICTFARSVGDHDAVYAEQLLPTASGTPLVTPSTFVRSADHYDPTRPRPGADAPGAPDGTGGFVDGSNALHAEQHFEYLGSFRAGDRVRVQTSPGRTWTKEGRSGQLQFYETVTEYSNSDGEVLLRARKVSVRLPDGADS